MRLHPRDDAFVPHRFGTGAPFRIAVEEALFVVETKTHAVSSCVDRLLAGSVHRLASGRVSADLCDGVAGLATPMCESADEAVGFLGELRRAVLDQQCAVLLGSGVHPAAPFGASQHRLDGDHGMVVSDVGCVLRQAALCGVRLHVAMPDAETAIAAFNGMRKWVPLLQALGANSPYWHGLDSGLASARTLRMHSLPRSGLPRSFVDWEEYCAAMDELARVAGTDAMKSLWWDIRPDPARGTLELGVFDAQSSLGDVRGLMALAHCLVYHEALTADPVRPAKEVLDEASFHAIRDGLDARLPMGGALHHVQGLARQAIDLASGYAASLGCVDALLALEPLLASGNGADRQRRAFAEGGVHAVLRTLVSETESTARPAPAGLSQLAAL
jgi:glutamate---cysteine ligase / carboxylate-amine ligase